MKPKSLDYAETVAGIFNRAAYIGDLGIRLAGMGPGWCESVLAVLPRHMQQDGYVHAGVQATIADHTAGGAVGTLAAEGDLVLSVEFKINFLRPAVGDSLRCRGTVLRQGKTLCVA